MYTYLLNKFELFINGDRKASLLRQYSLGYAIFSASLQANIKRAFLVKSYFSKKLLFLLHLQVALEKKSIGYYSDHIISGQICGCNNV